MTVFMNDPATSGDGGSQSDAIVTAPLFVECQEREGEKLTGSRHLEDECERRGGCAPVGQVGIVPWDCTHVRLRSPRSSIRHTIQSNQEDTEDVEYEDSARDN